MKSAIESLERLKSGNQRFVTDRMDAGPGRSPARREELVSGQSPFAAVLGCIDSRVPVEVVFDVGFGDLMVVRVAGNYASPAVLGSLEFAAAQTKTPLIVVLGHTGCGAMRATYEALENSAGKASGHLQGIVDALAPAFVNATEQSDMEPDAILANATEEHVRATVKRICDESETLAGRVERGELLIVCALYDLRSGIVKFLD